MTTDDLDARMIALTTRFLEAFKRIEHDLRQRAGAGSQFLSWQVIVDRDKAATIYRSRLLRFSDLRNVISHEPSDNGVPIATPLPRLVDEIEKVADAILRPPNVGSFVQGQKVVSATPDESIGTLLVRLQAGDYSQAPVIGMDSVGLVTTNAFARWAADQLNEFGMVDATEATVQAVMTKLETHERAVTVARTAELARAFNVLREAALGKTNGPTAVLVTNSGKAGEKILGVIVQADLVRMAERLALY